MNDHMSEKKQSDFVYIYAGYIAGALSSIKEYRSIKEDNDFHVIVDFLAHKLKDVFDYERIGLSESLALTKTYPRFLLNLIDLLVDCYVHEENGTWSVYERLEGERLIRFHMKLESIFQIKEGSFVPQKQNVDEA